MKKSIAVLVILVLTTALADAITVKFRTNSREVDTIEKNGKTLADIGELSFALGVQYSVSGNNVTVYLGKKIKTVVTGSLGGRFDWVYVDPILVAKNLGYSSKLETITNASKVSTDVLTVNYAGAVKCEDFSYWEDAQKFFTASSNLTAREFDDRDPYKLDRGKDGTACEFLPRMR